MWRRIRTEALFYSPTESWYALGRRPSLGAIAYLSNQCWHPFEGFPLWDYGVKASLLERTWLRARMLNPSLAEALQGYLARKKAPPPSGILAPRVDIL